MVSASPRPPEIIYGIRLLFYVLLAVGRQSALLHGLAVFFSRATDRANLFKLDLQIAAALRRNKPVAFSA